MNRFGFLILSILRNNEATNKYQAMTVQEIKDSEEWNYEIDTFYRQLKKFVLDGLVGQGAKDSRANTYYLTQKGKSMLEEVGRNE